MFVFLLHAHVFQLLFNFSECGRVRVRGGRRGRGVRTRGGRGNRGRGAEMVVDGPVGVEQRGGRKRARGSERGSSSRPCAIDPCVSFSS